MLFIDWKINVIRMYTQQVFPSDAEVMNLPANVENIGDAGSVPGLGRSPGRGNGNPLHYSCLNGQEEPLHSDSLKSCKVLGTTERLSTQVGPR